MGNKYSIDISRKDAHGTNTIKYKDTKGNLVELFRKDHYTKDGKKFPGFKIYTHELPYQIFLDYYIEEVKYAETKQTGLEPAAIKKPKYVGVFYWEADDDNLCPLLLELGDTFRNPTLYKASGIRSNKWESLSSRSHDTVKELFKNAVIINLQGKDGKYSPHPSQNGFKNGKLNGKNFPTMNVNKEEDKPCQGYVTITQQLEGIQHMNILSTWTTPENKQIRFTEPIIENKYKTARIYYSACNTAYANGERNGDTDLRNPLILELVKEGGASEFYIRNKGDSKWVMDSNINTNNLIEKLDDLNCKYNNLFAVDISKETESYPCGTYCKRHKITVSEYSAGKVHGYKNIRHVPKESYGYTLSRIKNGGSSLTLDGQKFPIPRVSQVLLYYPNCSPNKPILLYIHHGNGDTEWFKRDPVDENKWTRATEAELKKVSILTAIRKSGLKKVLYDILKELNIPECKNKEGTTIIDIQDCLKEGHSHNNNLSGTVGDSDYFGYCIHSGLKPEESIITRGDDLLEIEGSNAKDPTILSDKHPDAYSITTFYHKKYDENSHVTNNLLLIRIEDAKNKYHWYEISVDGTWKKSNDFTNGGIKLPVSIDEGTRGLREKLEELSLNFVTPVVLDIYKGPINHPFKASEEKSLEDYLKRTYIPTNGRSFVLSETLNNGNKIGGKPAPIHYVQTISVYYWGGKDTEPILFGITKTSGEVKYYGKNGKEGTSWLNGPQHTTTELDALDHQNCQLNNAIPFEITDPAIRPKNTKSNCLNNYRRISFLPNSKNPPGSNYTVKEYTINNGAKMSRITYNNRDINIGLPKTYPVSKVRMFFYPGSGMPLMLQFIKKDVEYRAKWYYSTNPHGTEWQGHDTSGTTFYDSDDKPTEALTKQLDKVICKYHNGVTVDLSYKIYKSEERYCCDEHQEDDLKRISANDVTACCWHQSNPITYHKHTITDKFKLAAIMFKEHGTKTRRNITLKGLPFPISGIDSVSAFYCGKNPVLIYVQGGNPQVNKWYQKNGNTYDEEWVELSDDLQGITPEWLNIPSTCENYNQLVNVMKYFVGCKDYVECNKAPLTGYRFAPRPGLEGGNGPVLSLNGPTHPVVGGRNPQHLPGQFGGSQGLEPLSELEGSAITVDSRTSTLPPELIGGYASSQYLSGEEGGHSGSDKATTEDSKGLLDKLKISPETVKTGASAVGTGGAAYGGWELGREILFNISRML
ncbi:hypothetical protein BEWA_045620 [Theileria equi strain WA]|uniref:Uncharacterized protein n=1 Tax=Theileria equi strain WA TaxID=1537102 RepID=L1LAA3_THEEQ|nr:hypothetical protein BEWA_045620 [Theileria equi strain WA]EKX72098.1 hypothetical protein BEWA_045620 [Theileria equi strain WA]|eukprot:XP_004831550.1 hypothetical protein BEWA_045620 [Theileria equi strain WA]